MSTWDLHVLGTPAPQGSKRHVGRGILVESSKKVGPWREAVVAAAITHDISGINIDTAVDIDITFWFARPKSHFATKGLRVSAPIWPAVKPDIDKVVRSTLDALVQADILRDDALVTALAARKRYADGTSPGAHIRISTPDISSLE